MIPTKLLLLVAQKHLEHGCLMLTVFQAVFLCHLKPWRRDSGPMQPHVLTASLSVLLFPALLSGLLRVPWTKAPLFAENSSASKLFCFQAFHYWFVFGQPAPNPAPQRLC